MNREDAAPSRLQRLVNASWPLFTAFGAQVTVHWTVLAVPFLVLGLLVQCGLHPIEAATWALPWTLALYLSIWTHELAHVVVARRLGAPGRAIALSAAGGLAHAEVRLPSARAEMLTALAGPFVQMLWILALGLPWLAFDIGGLAREPVANWRNWAAAYQWFLGWQTAMFLLNVVPCYPMDGGRVLRGFFARKVGANKASMLTAQIGFGLSIALVLAGMAGVYFLKPGERALDIVAVMTGFVGFTSFLACRHLEAEAALAERPAAPVEAWKAHRAAGAAAAEDSWRESLAESERLSRAEERRERRAAEARRQEEGSRRRLQERIDELLDRINEVGGIDKLPDGERRELAEASELLRREPAER